MTRRVEAEGNTIDEAIGRALSELGVTRDQARIEILQNARRGLLGIGSQNARVAATSRTASGESEPPTGAGASADADAALARDDVVPAAEEESRSGEGERAAEPREEKSARDVLSTLLSRMGFEASVVSGSGGDEGTEQVLRIESEDSSLVIGRHGQTLDALEYLVNRIIGKREERGSRIVVDCEDYRERHREALRQTATRLAEKVRERGRSQTMIPMSPRDRRVVHMTLADSGEVVTRSVGQGFLRRVVISPARGRHKPRS